MHLLQFHALAPGFKTILIGILSDARCRRGKAVSDRTRFMNKAGCNAFTFSPHPPLGVLLQGSLTCITCHGRFFSHPHYKWHASNAMAAVLDNHTTTGMCPCATSS